MRIGISMHTRQGLDIWNDGIGQASYHLATLLASLPFVEQVYLVNCGEGSEPPYGTDAVGRRFALISLTDASELLDLTIEMSGRLTKSWTEQFRAKGGKVVLHSCLPPHAALVEQTMFSSTVAGQTEGYDEVWIHAKDMPFASMIRGLHRCPVFEVPFLWSAAFLEASARGAKEGAFGYRRGTLSQGPARPAIFEPNVSPLKMGTVPLLICEEIERCHPEALSQVQFFNGGHLLSRPGFAHLVAGSRLYASGKLMIYHRDYVAHVMARGTNVVVSHQVDAAQNYLYLDVLAGGYPLVHNSPLCSEVGYYYPFCDVEAGMAAFMRALYHHDRHLDDYISRSSKLIAGLAPEDGTNQERYACRILALCRNGQFSITSRQAA